MLENKIFACLLLRNSLFEEIQFEEKYFKNKKIFRFFKELYDKYKYIDVELILKHSPNNNNAINFVMECMSEEPSPSKCFGYYEQLKEEYIQSEIDVLNEKLKRKEITYKEFTKLFSKITKEFDEEEILKINNITIDEKVEREYTGLAELDFLTKGIEYGRLSLWSGITNHGKTTLMIQFAKECLGKGKKIFYFSGEQTASEFKNYLYVGMCKKEQLEFVQDEENKKIYDVKPKAEVMKRLDELYNKYIYLYNNNIPENNVETMIRVMNKAYLDGVRIFFIDNFMQLDNSEQLDQQTKIIEQFKRFARDKNCIINLVAHPRKTQFNINRLSIFDIAGTQNIANKSANICTIIRTDILPEDEKESIGKVLANYDYDIDECDGIVEVLKTKGNSCKMVGLKYDADLKTYKEVPKVLPSQRENLKEKYVSKNRKR